MLNKPRYSDWIYIWLVWTFFVRNRNNHILYFVAFCYITFITMHDNENLHLCALKFYHHNQIIIVWFHLQLSWISDWMEVTITCNLYCHEEYISDISHTLSWWPTSSWSHRMRLLSRDHSGIPIFDFCWLIARKTLPHHDDVMAWKQKAINSKLWCFLCC